MNTAMLGLQATAGLNTAALGLEWAMIPAGRYEIGAEDRQDNPVRYVGFEEAFELARTPTTNKQFAKGLELLGGGTTLLSVSFPGYNRRIIARGTKPVIEDLTLTDIKRSLNDGITAGDMARFGSLWTFHIFTEEWV